MIDDDAVTAAEKSLSYPSSTMAGMSMEPMAAVSLTAAVIPDRRQDVGVGETALKVSHEDVAELDEAGGDARLVHDLPGQDEGHGHRGEHVHPGEIPLGYELEHRGKLHLQHGGEAADAEHEADGHARR